MFTGRDTLKWRNIQRYPYASLCVDWREPPYESIILDGPIEEVDRSLYELVHLMALRYYGKEQGEKFSEANLICKRPEGGISPIYWNYIVGKKSKRYFKIDDFIYLK